MKFLFDEKISFRILKSLPDTFFDASHVKKEGLINSQDKEIWKFAKRNGYTIVTQDSNFNDLNSLYGFPPKIIWIRTGNITTQAIVDILLGHLVEIKSFLSESTFWCFEIYRFKGGSR